MVRVSSHMNHFADNSSAEVALDVSLHSLLFGNVELISSILYPTHIVYRPPPASSFNHIVLWVMKHEAMLNSNLQQSKIFCNAKVPPC